MSVLHPGLVSVTFRHLAPQQIVALAALAQTQWIEWGGDVHVPHGDTKRARDVGVLTRDAGLHVAAYGSYLRVGVAPAKDFPSVVETAAALGAPLIRVWAGARSSADATEAEHEAVVSDTRHICELAAQQNIVVAFEFHGGTLADSVDATLSLISDVSRPNLRTLWQPLGTSTPDERRSEVERLLPHLANVHVYHWDAGQSFPLAQGEEAWRGCLAALSQADRPVGLLLEFVRDASSEQFLADANALRAWLAE